MYSLRLLGVVVLEGPSGPVSGRATQRRRLALLALLGSAAEDGWARDKLTRLLWPETGDGQARHLLSDSLYVLRRELGEDAVKASGEVLRLDPAVVWTDVAEFEAAIRRGELNEAVSLYRGPFLEGFYLGDGADLEHWLDGERSRLAGLYAKALESLAQQAEDAGESTSAVEWWQKLAAQDPYDSRIALRLMEAHVAAGNRGAALEYARVHELLMQEEVGADPAPEVLAYAAKLRQRQERVAGAGAIAERPAEARSEGARAVLGETVVATPPAARSPLRKPALSVAAVTLAVLAAAAVLWLNRGPTGPAASARFTQLTFSGNVSQAEISPDGELLAYVEAGDPGRLLVKDLRGETVIEIAAIGEVVSLRWSPNGSELLFVGQDSGGRRVAVTYPRLGGTPRPLPRWHPYTVWSPDGSRVAQWNQETTSKIWFTTLAAGDTSLIDSLDSLYLWHGDWSRDGRFIALNALGSSRKQDMLWTGAVDGSGWQRVVADTLGLSGPSWSPREDAIYYFRGDELRKVRVTPEGAALGEPEVLQIGLEGLARRSKPGPSLTGDGRKLVFTKEQRYSNLWRATVDGPGEEAAFTTVQLTRGTALKVAPQLSPDGEWIAYVQLYRGTGGGDVFVVPAAGGTARRLTSHGEVDYYLAWSPDGRTLAYTVRGLGAGKVRTIAFEGGAERTYEETTAGPGIAWAPGERILYMSDPGRAFIHFRLLDPATEAEEALVSDSVGWMFDARYSPDAQSVVVYWNRPRSVWVISLRDSSQTQLLSGYYSPLGWSSDGRSVYLRERGSDEILLFPVSGGEPTIVATVPFESADCTPIERPPGLTLLCAVFEWVSDVWMIENFDPDIR